MILQTQLCIPPNAAKESNGQCYNNETPGPRFTPPITLGKELFEKLQRV